MSVELIRAGGNFGPVAQRLLAAGFNTNALRTTATLRKDEWKHFDDAVLKTARRRLVGVADLRSRGLELNLANGLGKTVLEYEDMSDMEGASVSMDGVTRGRNEVPEYSIKYLPLPIVHRDFQISVRKLYASRERGEALDTTSAEQATNAVAEQVEGMLYMGYNTFAYGGGTIYGLTDVPTRNTGSLSGAWDDTGCEGEDILGDVLRMKQAAINDRKYGPYMLYIPTAYETKLDDEFKANSDISVRERLMKISGIEGVRVSDFLTGDNVLLVQLTADVARIVNGMEIQTVEWRTDGDMVFNFKVMCIQVPQIRADQSGRSGVVHFAA